jgi:hypothetical protein
MKAGRRKRTKEGEPTRKKRKYRKIHQSTIPEFI